MCQPSMQIRSQKRLKVSDAPTNRFPVKFPRENSPVASSHLPQLILPHPMQEGLGFLAVSDSPVQLEPI